MAQNRLRACNHPAIRCTPSSHAAEVGYSQPGTCQLAEATEPIGSRKAKKQATYNESSSSTFPAPSLLPGDELSFDPDYPAQSFQDWVEEEDRNDVTAHKNIIYVVPPPAVDVDMRLMEEWSKPQKGGEERETPMFHIQDIVGYISAFYHGLSVRLISSSKPCFVAWESAGKTRSTGKSRSSPQYVGLSIGSECVRIRTRVSPDGIFARQLNLDDLLDAAISMLPKDAYALLFLVHHDLYEDEDDQFACGRAYGGSRVAVVSSVRYNPHLDNIQCVDRLHMWPASHCEDYIASCYPSPAKTWKTSKRTRGQPKTAENKLSPLDAALSTFIALGDVDSSPSLLSALWLGRVCRTASHELGHCFGIDHCVYYACVMQGSASLAEDARQPLHLCPIDLAKLLRATGTTSRQRYIALVNFCNGSRTQNTHIFSPLATWIRAHLHEMDMEKEKAKAH